MCTGACVVPLALSCGVPCAAQSIQMPQVELPVKHSGVATLNMIYTGDANADVSGGEQTGTAYLHRIGIIGDLDLQALAGWEGARAHVSVHSIAGTGLSTRRVGNALTVSGIEAEPALRLFNVWIEQKLGVGATLRLGQFNVDQNFAISSTASLFVNSTFGWPGSFAVDLPSGEPAYPLAGPGVSLSVAVARDLMARVAVFTGAPAGQGGGDPQQRDKHGFNGWQLNGGPFVIGEVQRSAGGDDPAWLVKLGGWAHFGRFDDQRFDGGGVSLANERTTGVPLRHPGNFGIYAIADARLWHSDKRSLHGFVRATWSPADRNAVDLYWDVGFAFTGALRSRPDDIFGLGLAVARLSAPLRALQGDACTIAVVKCHTPNVEAVIEVTYQLQISDRFHVQPNIQYVVHPAGDLIAEPGTPRDLPGNALILGLRSSFRL